MNVKKVYNVPQTGAVIPYLLALPDNYEGAENFPLVVFLHGSGERGDDGYTAGVHGFPRYAGEGKSYPFILVSPQCPKDKYWGSQLESLNFFLDYLIKEYRADACRVYLTGLSMGGMGTWLWAQSDPERFAAIAPVCGNGIFWYGEALKNIPVWAFHGDADECMPYGESVRMVKAVNDAGGCAKLTTYKGVGHGCWDLAYSDPELIKWLLSNKKK